MILAIAYYYAAWYSTDQTHDMHHHFFVLPALVGLQFVGAVPYWELVLCPLVGMLSQLILLIVFHDYTNYKTSYIVEWDGR